MQIFIVLGTRPELIKLAPLIHESQKRGHQAKVILTGQHREMMNPLLDFFGITPDFDLNVMTHNQSLTSLSQRVLEGLNLMQERTHGIGSPDYFIVQGDTTSAFAAAFWAFCNKIPIGHVEAGLRTRDLSSPFPEEGNRQLISRLADLHFAPTSDAAAALHSEQIPSHSVFTVGNTSIDTLLHSLQRIRGGDVPEQHRLPQGIREFAFGRKVILVTAHRRENQGEGIRDICQAIREIIERSPGAGAIYPVHPNPNVREPVRRLLADHPRILLCDPLPYGGFIELMALSDLLLTDSGGIQEEAPSLRRPILVMRKETERPEGVAAGFSRLVGTRPSAIVSAALEALANPQVPDTPNPYGDGQAARRILDTLEARYGRAGAAA